MAKLSRDTGATSQIFEVFIRDSSSTTGAGLTGLTNASSGLTAYYHRNTDTTATAISIVTMTVGTFASGGFKEIDSTNMPGWYQFCPPNAALASGAASVSFHLKGVTNMAPLPIEVDLKADVNTVRLAGQAVTAAAGVTFPTSVGTSTYAGGAVASVTAGVTVTTNNDKTGYTASTVSDKTGYSIGTGGITTGSFAAGAIDAGAIATDAIGSTEISAAAVTKIQTGLATPTNITSATGVVLSSGGVDAVWAKTMTELSAVPGVTASALSALTWIFELARNKVTQTATTQTVLKDDGTTTLATSTVSDDGTTFTRGKFS